jgi:hypothetical protein
MRPVRTASSNLVYVGPTPDIGDLHCERLAPGRIRSVWWFTPAERRSIAEGANLSLTILGEPIPPVSLHLIRDAGVGNDAPDVLERLETLRGLAPEPTP